MQTSLLICFLTGIVVGWVAGWLIAQGRIKELVRIVGETRDREKAAVDRTSLLDEELKKTIEERGALQNQVARLDEVRHVLAEKEARLGACQETIANLERDKAVALEQVEGAIQQANGIIATERDAQKRIIEAKDQQIAKLNEFIDQAKAALSKEFKALSVEVLRDASDQLVRTTDGLIEKHGQQVTTDVDLHKEEIKNLLQPVEQTIKNLDQHVAESNQARATAEALLNDQVRRLAGASESLSNALRKPVVRGSWGEIELENTLESAGLEGEIDFILQHTTDGEDGRKRTDAIINLPKGRKLIIDSKNLMESYVPLMNAEDEAQRIVLAERHSRSLRVHIKELASQEYWRRYEGLDCVILFIPHDGMYHAAIKDEAELIREASSRRVFIANPMSLIPLLKAVRYVLDQERLNHSAAEISAVGTKLYEDITKFAGKMVTIGLKLRATVDAYNKALPALDRFIVSNSRKLKKLGSAKGGDPKKVEEIRDIEPNRFSSRELQQMNSLFEQDSVALELAANSEDESSESRT